MKKKQIKVYLSDSALTKIDAFVSELKSNKVETSRSQIIEVAIDDYLKRMNKDQEVVKIS